MRIRLVLVLAVVSSCGGSLPSGNSSPSTPTGVPVGTKTDGVTSGAGATTGSDPGGGTSGAGATTGSDPGGATTGSDPSGGTSGVGGTPGRLRLMEGNLSSGTNQSYDNGEGGRIFHGLNPDVATMQEFNFGDNSATTIRGFVDTNFGTQYSYFRETVAGGGAIPNGIISRYPILQSGSWTDPNVANRGFAYAEIAIPGPTPLWVISTHMLTTSAANRNAEATTIIADIKANVPAGDYLMVGGDFNTGSRTEVCMSTYAADFTVTGPYPADNNGNTDTSEPRSKPHDWIITSPALSARETPVVIGTNSFANGLVVDTSIYTPLSDIAPAELGDSHASGEQHMGVVKDFSL